MKREYITDTSDDARYLGIDPSDLRESESERVPASRSSLGSDLLTATLPGVVSGVSTYLFTNPFLALPAAAFTTAITTLGLSIGRTLGRGSIVIDALTHLSHPLNRDELVRRANEPRRTIAGELLGAVASFSIAMSVVNQVHATWGPQKPLHQPTSVNTPAAPRPAQTPQQAPLFSAEAPGPYETTAFYYLDGRGSR